MQKNTKTNWFQSHKKITIGIGIFLSLYFVSLFVPFISNYTQFPLYVAKCGHLPYVGTIGSTYKVPGDSLYSVTGLEEAFFCTEQEAEAAGYRKTTFGD